MPILANASMKCTIKPIKPITPMKRQDNAFIKVGSIKRPKIHLDQRPRAALTNKSDGGSRPSALLQLWDTDIQNIIVMQQLSYLCNCGTPCETNETNEECVFETTSCTQWRLSVRQGHTFRDFVWKMSLANKILNQVIKCLFAYEAQTLRLSINVPHSKSVFCGTMD